MNYIDFGFGTVSAPDTGYITTIPDDVDPVTTTGLYVVQDGYGSAVPIGYLDTSMLSKSDNYINYIDIASQTNGLINDNYADCSLLINGRPPVTHQLSFIDESYHDAIAVVPTGSTAARDDYDCVTFVGAVGTPFGCNEYFDAPYESIPITSATETPFGCNEYFDAPYESIPDELL